MGDRGSGPPLKNLKNIVFLSNIGPDLLKNLKATKPAFNVGPSSACQRNAILMVFRWRADDAFSGMYLDSFLPLSTYKKNSVGVGPPLTKLSGSVHVVQLI